MIKFYENKFEGIWTKKFSQKEIFLTGGYDLCQLATCTDFSTEICSRTANKRTCATIVRVRACVCACEKIFFLTHNVAQLTLWYFIYVCKIIEKYENVCFLYDKYNVYVNIFF